MIFDRIMKLIESGAVFTDVYLRSGEPIRIRTPAGWESDNGREIAIQDIERFSESIAGAEWQEMVRQSGGAMDVAKTIGGRVRLRCNIFNCGSAINEYAVSVRKLPLTPPSMEEIGFSPALIKTIKSSTGLWLFTGPTGNGKSTTIAAMLEDIGRTESKHILTIEQPIEYVLTSKKSIITQREVGPRAAVPSFSQGLISAMRQRPDVIMIGEVRDIETLETIFQAGESGHLVMSSLHTKNTEDAINKISGFIGDTAPMKLQALSSTLRGVISHTLLPTKDKKNLVLAYEVMINTPEAQHAIRNNENQKIRNIITSSRKEGACLLNESLEKLVKNNIISIETAMNAAYDKPGLQASSAW